MPRLFLLIFVGVMAASPAPVPSLLPPFGWSARTARPAMQGGTILGAWVSPSGDADILLAEESQKGTLAEARRTLLKAQMLAGSVVVYDRAVRICDGKQGGWEVVAISNQGTGEDVLEATTFAMRDDILFAALLSARHLEHLDSVLQTSLRSLCVPM